MLRISKTPSQSRGNDSLRTIVFLGGDSHTQGGQEGWTASGMQRRGKARSKVQIFELRHMKKSRFLWISNVGVNWWVCGWAICRPCQTFHVLTCGRFRLALHVFGVLDSQIRMASTWLPHGSTPDRAANAISLVHCPSRHEVWKCAFICTYDTYA